MLQQQLFLAVSCTECQMVCVLSFMGCVWIGRNICICSVTITPSRHKHFVQQPPPCPPLRPAPAGPREGENDMETYHLVQELAAQGVADVSRHWTPPLPDCPARQQGNRHNMLV
jgi:hypothetical protein